MLALCVAPVGATAPVLVGGCVANAATSCTPATIGGHVFASGQFEYVFAFRTATTAPTLPAGFVQIATASASVSSFRSACTVTTGSSPVSGTWTNATRVGVLIYSGANVGLGTSLSCPSAIGFKTAAGTSGTTSTYTFTGGTLTNTSGDSVVIGAVGSSAAPCTPASLTAQESSTNIILNDTNGGVASFTTATCTGTAGNWKTDTLEILPQRATTATVTLIGSATISATTCIITAAAGVAAGHLVLIASPKAGTTGSVTLVADTGLNTYNASDAAITDASDNSGINLSSGYMASPIAASGTITVTNTGITNGGCVAYDFSTGASSSWLDKAASLDNGFGTSNNTGTTAATAHQPNINFGAFSGGSSCPTGGTGWTFPSTPLFSTTLGTRCLNVGWQEVTSTGTQVLTITIGGGDDFAGAIGSYKEGGAAAACTPTLTLLGVGRCG